MKERNRKFTITLGTDEVPFFKVALDSFKKDKETWGNQSYEFSLENQHVTEVVISCRPHVLFILGKRIEREKDFYRNTGMLKPDYYKQLSESNIT